MLDDGVFVVEDAERVGHNWSGEGTLGERAECPGVGLGFEEGGFDFGVVGVAGGFFY